MTEAAFHWDETGGLVGASPFMPQTSAETLGRILVVEDAQCTQRTEIALLHRMHFEVDVAEDGISACEMAEKSRAANRPYNLILMDMQLPKMRGEEATRWLRRSNWDGPIVAVSILSSDVEREKFIDAGCDDAITKPVTELSLKKAILHNLGIDVSESLRRSSTDVEERHDVPSFAWHGRVLVVEDARCVRMSVGAILKKTGLSADMAEDGQIACEKAEKSREEGKPYDLILMDMQMPRMNGDKATRWLREHHWEGPIVAVSIQVTEEEHKEVLEAGCDDYVSKPVTESKLREIFQRFLKHD
jgi:CheY-like chemotaxis protein